MTSQGTADDVATRLRAIRDLALDALEKAERGDSESPGVETLKGLLRRGG